MSSSSTIIELEDRPAELPSHPGEILREEFLAPMGLSRAKLARTLGVQPHRIAELAAEHRPVTPDLAVLLGKVLGTSAEFWMRLQMRHDLERARRLHQTEINALPTLTAA